MPDPTDPSPVKAEKRDGKFVVVGSDGHVLANSGAFDDAEKARSVADQVNEAWKKAKEERQARGAPEVTREARVARRAGSFETLLEGLARPIVFNPALHPHEGRTGKFAETLHGLGNMQSARTTANVRVTRTGPEHFMIHGPYLGEHLADHHGPGAAAKAAAQALMIHDSVAGKGARLVDAKGVTVSRHPSKAEAARHKKPGQKVAGMLEESLFSHGSTLHLRFDPRLHRRDRNGEFASMIAKLTHGSDIELPHGVKLHKTRAGFTVGDKKFDTPEVASAHALHLVDREEIARGADYELLSRQSSGEFGVARKAAIRAGSFHDMAHAEGLRAEIRLESDRRSPQPDIFNHRGRTRASKQAYAERSHGAAHHLVGVLDPTPRRLPEDNDAANQVRPRLSGMSLSTGYGRYEARPMQGTTGLYQLHHDSHLVGTLGTQERAQHVLGALHDEALVRHRLAKRTALQKRLVA